MCLTAQEKIRNRINIKNKTAGHAGIACFSFALKGNRAGSSHFKIVRFKWWEHVTGRNILFGFVLSTMMIPWCVTIIPKYSMIQAFGWMDSYKALIIPAMFSGFGLFSIAIFQFLWTWEDFLWPYLVITNKDKQLLAVGLKMFNGQYSTDYGALFAATAISIIPVLLIYLFFQKQFIAGIAASAVKG